MDTHHTFVRVIQGEVEVVTVLSELRHPHAQPEETRYDSQGGLKLPQTLLGSASPVRRCYMGRPPPFAKQLLDVQARGT